jgi:hypothetical protein
VSSIGWSGTAIDGESITFQASVTNNGGSTTRTFQVLFEDYVNHHVFWPDIFGYQRWYWSYMQRRSIDGLENGETKVVSFSMTARGSKYVRAVPNFEMGYIREADYLNNFMEVASPVKLPDFVISEIHWHPKNIVIGKQVTYYATISNIGGGTTRTVQVDFARSPWSKPKLYSEVGWYHIGTKWVNDQTYSRACQF